MSDVDLVVYSKGLEDLPVDDLIEVVRTLSITPREEFEPRIPELGDLRRMVQRVGWQRKREAREADERRRVEEYRRLVLRERQEDARNGCGIHAVPLDFDAMLDKVCGQLDMGPKGVHHEKKAQTPCRHCGNPESSDDPEELRRMSRYYERRALAIEDRIAMEEEKAACLAAEAANAAQPAVSDGGR